MTRLIVSLCLLAAALTSRPPSASAVEITISCGALGIERALCASATESWAAQTGHEVRIVSSPPSASERLALYQQMLAAGAADIDVYQIDIIWPGILGAHFIDLRPYVDHEVLAGHFEAIVEANRLEDGKLVAMPWYTDAGLLYYRRDLLEAYGRPVPETWTELAETAAIVQEGERAAGDDGFWGFVWQGRAYEGLTCNALEWIASSNGGTIVEADGRISIDNPRAARALDIARSWVGRISPPGVLNYAEEEARGVFQSGNALFMRNWPYAWALANAETSPVRGKVGVAALPRGGGGRHAATLGGWQLAVSRYSKHPDIAADLVLYLTSAAEQKRRAIRGAYNPTIRALYEDKEVLEANPFFDKLESILEAAVARPSAIIGVRYNRASSAIWNAVHQTLEGEAEAAASLRTLATRLDRLSRGGRW